MAFKKKWFSSKVVSSDGYSVMLLNRSLILYEDANRRVYVSAEMLASNGWALYPNDMRVGSAEGEQLQDEKLRSLIVNRIREVFNFVGRPLEV